MSMAAGQGAATALQTLPVRIRRIGRKHRTYEWWEDTVLQTFDDEQWLENLRMRRDTFFQLVEKIRQPLERAENCVLPGLSVEKKVAIAIYRLASVGEYRTVGNPFGVHKSTVCECLHSVVRAINSRAITCQHPGSVHDAVVLRDSDLYRNSHRLIPESDRGFHGETMPYVIIGDAAYPLLNWLINDYRIEQTPEEVSFNLYLHKARIVAEHAFGRLKGRWRILCKRSELDVYFMPEVILACCILHNFVEIAKDPFMDGWLNIVQNANAEFPQPDREIPRGNQGGQEVRDRMRDYIEEHYPLLNRE